MSNPSGFTWQSWNDTQDEALASQRRDESEQAWLGEQVHAERMRKIGELDIEFKQLLEDIK